MVLVNNLTIELKKQVILNNVSCELTAGRITSFIGKSGAGKTTLLKSLIGLVSSQSGTITIHGKVLSALDSCQRAEHIGYVFQDFNLFPHMTVLENCIDPQRIHGVLYDDARAQALLLLQEFGMEQFGEKYPSELSGGQKQRVAIVRALCLKPQVLLLDEPTASLDPYNTEILVTLLQKLAKKGLIIGLSSQDMSFINKIFDQVYYLEDGKIVEFCDKQNASGDCPLIKNFMQYAG